ncbi:MAG TPA: hypothetical protein VHW71_19265 [Steroidobacteraceae bacterium]|nr:hypothetical protein [Steroidobacteraceae bacterium]
MISLLLSSCGGRQAAPQSETSARSVLLSGEDQPLRDDFNRDQGFVRLLFVVDPICPECLRGLADMGHDVLAKLPKDARIKVYVVHDPVIGGASKDIPAAAELLHTALARNYWDPSGDFGRQMAQVLSLLHGTRPVYAWDVWMIYPPNAVWNAKDPPRPAFLMHQLPGLDDAKFPPLDSKVFFAKVNDMLAANSR